MSTALAVIGFIACTLGYLVQVTSKPEKPMAVGISFAAMLITAVIAGNMLTGGQ